MTPTDLIPGGTSTLVNKYPPGGYSYDYRCTSTPRYFYPRVRLLPKEVRGVLLHFRCTITPRYFYPASVRLPPIHTGYFYPARARLPPGISALPGYDYPPYTGGYFYPARAGLPLPCQGRITPRYFYPVTVSLLPNPTYPLPVKYFKLAM